MRSGSTGGKSTPWRQLAYSSRLTLLLGGAADGHDLSDVWLEGFADNKAAEKKPARGKARYGDRAPLFTHVAEFLASIQTARNKLIWAHHNPAGGQTSHGMAL